MVEESKPEKKKEHKVVKFIYSFVVEKNCRISGFDVPDFYSNPDLAKEDIQMIVDFHDVYNKFERGIARFQTEVIYMPDEDGLYHPKIGELIESDHSLHTFKYNESQYEVIMRHSLWNIIKAKIKHYFKKNRNMKTKRK